MDEVQRRKSLQHPMMNWFGGGGVWTTLFISSPNFRAEDESEQKRTRSPPPSHFLCQSSCGVGSRSWQGRLTLTRGGAVRCWLCAVHCSTNMWCLFTSTVLPIVGGNCQCRADFCHNILTLAEYLKANMSFPRCRSDFDAEFCWMPQSGNNIDISDKIVKKWTARHGVCWAQVNATNWQ